jgi:hypothetical protein
LVRNSLSNNRKTTGQRLACIPDRQRCHKSGQDIVARQTDLICAIRPQSAGEPDGRPERRLAGGWWRDRR